MSWPAVCARGPVCPQPVMRPHQPGVRAEASVRTQTQPFHHRGTEPFDEHVRTGQHATHGRETLTFAQVSATERLLRVHGSGRIGLRRAPIHRHDVGAEVGQQLPTSGPGPMR